MTCSSTFLKYPLAVLAQTPAAYILMYCNATQKKGIDIGRYLVSEFTQNCPAPLFTTTKCARVAVLQRIRTSPRGDERQCCPCL